MQIYGSRVGYNILFQVVAACGSEMVRSGFKPERKSKTLQIAAGISLDGEKQRTSKHNNIQHFDYLLVIKNTSFLCGVFTGYSFHNKHSKYSLTIKIKTMAKKRIDEIALSEMIAGEYSNPKTTRSTGFTPSDTPTINSKQTKQQFPESPIEPEQESQKQLEESDELPKRIDKKYRRTSFEEYRQTFLQVPRIIDRKPVFVSASTREQLDRIVRQLGDRKMSVSGLIENLALNHLNVYQEDIEQWRKL